MIERFEADFSRQYRLGVNAAPVLGFAAAAGAGYLAGLGPVWGGVWALALTLALLWQRWIMLGVAYELTHDRLTIARGPLRTHIRWDAIERVREGRHRQHGVGGFVLERRAGRDVTVAPRQGARFIRALAARAPDVRFAWERGGVAAQPIEVERPRRQA